MRFSPETLLEQLDTCPAPHYWVAYSGGLDSHVLLHALAGLRERLVGELGAVHVNHGLQAAAGRWEAHCAAVCSDLDVPMSVLRVDAGGAAGDSPEAAARSARYAALAAWLPAGHCLLSAQHQDDQAETLLLQLLRGSGINGLAAMPQVAQLGAGRLLRPLLLFTRRALHDHAVTEGLVWMEDPSNTNTAFDRNFLRRKIMPVIRQRWPAAPAALGRSAVHCAEAAEILARVAEQDLGAVSDANRETIALSALDALPPGRQRNVLRHWFRQAVGQAPSTAVMTRILSDVLHCRRDATPCVQWGGFVVRRYRDALYLLCRTDAPDREQVLDWSLEEPLHLPGTAGLLRARRGTGRGIQATAASAAGVRVAWRRGGERCRPAGRGQHHSLKKLFQERGIPPWERQRIPLIYLGDELAAVADMWVCHPFQAGPGEAGLLIDWQKSDNRPEGIGSRRGN
ncbi:MAG: tRNA lysidine(34) synthetase TilS [Gammaproteobacteria bacterium]